MVIVTVVHLSGYRYCRTPQWLSLLSYLSAYRYCYASVTIVGATPQWLSLLRLRFSDYHYFFTSVIIVTAALQ